MGEWIAGTIPSSASLATVIAQANSNFSAGKTVVNGSIEGGGASVPNIAAATVDRTRMANNAKVGVYAAESGASGFVVTEGGTKGLQYVSAAAFVATYSSGTAWVRQTSTSPDDMVRVTKASNWTVTLTANSDNYVYIKSDSSVGVATTSVGGPAPTLPVDSLLLSVATTDGVSVTGTPVDKGPTSTLGTPKHYRTKGAWPFPTSTTNLRLPPGIIEVDGITSAQTANQDLDVSVAGNYVLGARTSNVTVFYLIGNNGGVPKFALTTSTPSAVTVSGGVTSGTVGTKQYRTIASVPYRYLGGHRLVAGGNLLLGQRYAGGEFIYSSTHSLLAAGNASTFTAVSLSTRVPQTAILARSSLFVAGGVVGTGATRATGTTGDGQRIKVNGHNYTFDRYLPTNSSQSVDYKINAGNTLDIQVEGYKEDLD